MEEKLLSFISDNALILPENRILLAVSGGADSMALLHFLYTYRTIFQCEIGVAHLHHGIRGKEADEDADYVQQFCKKFQIPFYLKKVNVSMLASSAKIGIEEAGRNARYAFFESIMKNEGYDLLATAHHRDDQAETLLMRLIRGTGLKGACGISLKNDKTIRPLLCVSKREIENYCKLHGLDYCTDCTNEDEHYLRNKIRHQIVPALNTINPCASRHLADFASKANDIQAFLDIEINQAENHVFGCHAHYCEIKILEELHPFLQKELLRRAVGNAGKTLKDIEQRHIDLIFEQLSKPATVWKLDLSNRVCVRREYQYLFFEQRVILPEERTKVHDSESGFKRRNRFSRVIESDDHSQLETFYLSLDHCDTINYNGMRFHIEILLTKALISSKYKKKRCEILLSCDTINTSICLRSRRSGDTIRLPGTDGHKKVKDLLIDRKIPRIQRDTLPMLAMGSEILWIPDIAVDKRCIDPDPASETTIKITMENIDEPGH